MAATIGFQHESLWHIVPTETPRVLRGCPHCGGIRRFASSDRFRLNGQQRRVDVWLIYRCCICDTTWNRTLFRRQRPEEIGRELYDRLQLNDRDTAWQYTFDVAQLKALGVVVEPVSGFTVERRVLRFPDDDGGTGRHDNLQRIRFALEFGIQVRLDRVLSTELGVSRSVLERWCERGLLHVEPNERHALRRPAKEGQLILFEEERLRPSPERRRCC